MMRKMCTAVATYTVSETIGEDGEMTIEFRTTNPPRGLDTTLYRWTGKPAALSVPPLTGGEVKERP